MKESFNSDEARKFLKLREEKENHERENQRKVTLQHVTTILKKEFEGSDVEVYLVGSILQPFAFTSRSDVDIVLKNYQGDRFALWAKLEKEIGKTLELILFETCHFQEFVLKNGFKVV